MSAEHEHLETSGRRILPEPRLKRLCKTPRLVLRSLLLSSLLFTFPMVHGQEKEPERRPRQLWAVLVGAEPANKRPGVTALEAGVDDLAQWLSQVHPPVWLQNNLLVFGSGGDAKLPAVPGASTRLAATREALENELPKWLRQSKIQEDDLIVIYFAGRAVSLAADPAKDRPSQVVRLLASDSDPEKPDKDGIDLHTLIERALIEKDSKLRSCRVVFWLETRLESEPGRPPTNRHDAKNYLASLTARPGRIAWLAGYGPREFELIGEKEDARRLFTRRLIDELGPVKLAQDTPKPGLMDVAAELLSEQELELRKQGLICLGGLPPEVGLRPEQLHAEEKAPRLDLVVQRGHSGRVKHVLATPDEDTLVTAAVDSTMRVWGLRDRSLRRTLARHNNGIRALALSADGRIVASGDGSGKTMFHDLAIGGDIILPDDAPSPDNIEDLVALPGRRPTRFAGLGSALASEKSGIVLWTIGADVKLDFNPVQVELPEGARMIAIASPTRLQESQEKIVALAGLASDGTVVLFDRDGAEVRRRRIEQAKDSSPVYAKLIFTPGGRRLVWADVLTGNGEVLDTADLSAVKTLPLPKQLKDLAVSPLGKLAVAAKDADRNYHIELLDLEAEQPGPATRVPALPNAWSEPKDLTWSADGRWLAAGRHDGLALWSVDEAGVAKEAKLKKDEPKEPNSNPGKDVKKKDEPREPSVNSGLAVAAGRLWELDDDGGMSAWELPPGGGPGDEKPLEAAWDRRIAPGRGAIERLALDPVRKRILAFVKDGSAWLWRLDDAAGPKRLPGCWKTGEFLPDGRFVLAADNTNPPKGIEVPWFRPGGVTVFGPEGQPSDDPRLELPLGPGLFDPVEQLAVDPLGRWVAASTNGRKLFVWDLKNPGPARSIKIEEPVNALAFSEDGRRLVSVDSYAARVFDLEPAIPTTIATIQNSQLPNPASDQVPQIKAVAWDPVEKDRLILGCDLGLIFAVRLSEPEKPVTLDGNDDGLPVVGLTFAAEGELLVAWFDDPKLVVFDRTDGRAFERRRRRNNISHSEWVTGAGGWTGKDGAMLVTAGKDACVRFWRFQPKEQDVEEIGALAVWDERSSKKNEADFTGPPRSWEWVGFTPKGRFDGSGRGTQFLRRVGQRVESLEQGLIKAFEEELAAKLSRGEVIAPPEWSDRTPPHLELKQPDIREVPVRVSSLQVLFDPDIKPGTLRLYQRGVQIPLVDTSGEPIKDWKPEGTTIQVALEPGENKFYIMCESPGTIDGRSEDITLVSTAPPRVGALHVVAIGFQNYDQFPLRYPVSDAQAVSKHLRAASEEGRPETVTVLTDDLADPEAIDRAFNDLKKAVRHRPDDRVVVFLAGHTAIGEDDQYYLLRQNFPFEKKPGSAVAVPPEQITLAQTAYAIAFADIYSRIVDLGALHRLVIIDACSPHKAISDPERQLRESRARRLGLVNRIGYLMASRPNMPSLEWDPLKHGLLTYSLLRGTGAELPPSKEPGVEAVFDKSRSALTLHADHDKNDIVTTEELQDYIQSRLPLLVSAAENRDDARSRGTSVAAKNPLAIEVKPTRENDTKPIGESESKSAGETLTQSTPIASFALVRRVPPRPEKEILEKSAKKGENSLGLSTTNR